MPQEGASNKPERVADAKLICEEFRLMATDVGAGGPGDKRDKDYERM